MHQSILNLVFDKWDGDTPISNCYETGLVREYSNDHIIKNLLSPTLFVRKCKLEDINDTENFFYPINYMCQLMRIIGEDSFVISDEILDYCREKNLKIILFCDHEINMDEKNVMKHLVEQLHKRNLPESNFYYLNNNSRLQQYKEELGCKLNVHTVTCLFEFMVFLMNQHPSVFNEDRESFFLFQNRRLRTHRIFTLAFLMKHDMLKDTDWSLINMFGGDGPAFFSFKDPRFLPYEKEFYYMTNLKNKSLKYEESYEDIDAQVCLLGDLESYHQSYVNIIAETYFDNYEIHITEKSFRSFYYYQLPIFVASYQHVEYVRKLCKLDFFDDLIDHSYDLEPNHELRMLMVTNEIKRLYDNKEMVIDFIKNNKDRLIYNHNLIKLYDKSYPTINLFRGFTKIKRSLV